jgi:RND family efflux transporter MFP subunit
MEERIAKLRAKVSANSAICLLFLIFVLMVTSGCEEKNHYAAPPPAPVTVSTPVQKDVVEFLEFTGTTQAIASVDIRARVQGILEKIHFKEGALVKKGDLLYTIEPDTYQASLDKAIGDLEAKKAQLERTEVEYQRNLRLQKENATSDRELTNSRAARDSAKADVTVANANLETAKINLGYTTVRSPLWGRIGRSVVDVGNLVGAGEFTLLTTINQYDPIYAYFTLNERDLLRIMGLNRHESGKDEREKVHVFMGLSDETGYPHQGEIDFVDLGVDQTTGTILLRGVFPNPPPPVILPGLFARLRVPAGTHEKALLAPERAIGSDQLGQYLLVVNNENIVEYRPVKVGVLEEGLREILEGIKADDRVIVNGLQRARPGAKVQPTEARLAPGAALPQKGPGTPAEKSAPSEKQ